MSRRMVCGGNAKMFDELLGRDEAAILDERQDRALPV
jgi:hypothetical protein